tara:strand:+ start:1845 stop:2144 length:300 start_codon:yes stop_codon:yes gene_type:complete
MAAGSGISRLGDMESGHQCWHPVKTVTGSANVMINKVPANKVGDITKTHKCGKKPPHPDKCSKGSKTLLINKKPAMRIGDLLSPGGAVMAEGSHSVLAG